MSRFYIEHKTPYLFVDCETTGLKPGMRSSFYPIDFTDNRCVYSDTAKDVVLTHLKKFN